MPFDEPVPTEIDGVPIWWTDVGGPCMGGIVFRTGRADDVPRLKRTGTSMRSGRADGSVQIDRIRPRDTAGELELLLAPIEAPGT